MESTVFDESISEIQQFYASRSIFITGATGFVGKVLLEKLVRCCPDIKTIYVFIRSKRGKSPEERLEALLNKECFDLVKEAFPKFKEKIIVVVGDLLEPMCGISDEDLETLRREVSIVFHSAARVRFTDPLRTAFQSNVIGTKNVLDLCQELPLLASLVFVSTAFSKRELDGRVPEEVGGYQANVQQVLDVLELLDDEAIEKITPNIIKNDVTTYQFSKAMAELLVEEVKESIPVSIVRPCIVCPTWKEPFPGWCDILQGITGLFIAAGRGFLRAVYAPPCYRVLAIPGDVVVNCIIATAWYKATTRTEGTFVVNCAQKYEDFPVGQELLKPVLKIRSKFPLTMIYRYPDFTVYKYKFLYQIHSVVDHYIPAIIIDTLLLIFTGKPLMIRLYRKIDTLWNIFLKQGSVQWNFCRDNYNKVQNAMAVKDAEVFFMNVDNLDWPEYISDCSYGGRKFLCKEDPSTIPYALMKGRIWWLVTSILKWCLILFFIYCLIPQSLIDSANTRFQSYLPTTDPVLEVPSDAINFH